jgi:hypothetical protein
MAFSLQGSGGGGFGNSMQENPGEGNAQKGDDLEEIQTEVCLTIGEDG